jgi:hypothetical protein
MLVSSLEAWVQALEARHLADLTFSEVSRALRALSSAYVERRARLSSGAALSGAGKRAAFALFYGPLHYLLVKHVATALGAARDRTSTLVDLGCGTGVAGAACAGSLPVPPPHLVGVDRHPWALAEASWTYALFGLKARTLQGDIAGVEWSGSTWRKPGVSPGPTRLAGGTRPSFARGYGGGIPRVPKEGTTATMFVAAFTLNELVDAERDAVMERLLARSRHGDSVLVVEPLAGFVAPWWHRWRDVFERAGGRGDEWRLRVQLPAIVAKLDRAAGLDHRELTGRSLWLGPARATGDDDAPAPQGGRRNVRDDGNSGHAGRRAMVLKRRGGIER